MSQFNVVILTPDKELFTGMVELLKVPTERGSLTVLAKNYPVLTLLTTGIISLQKPNEKKRMHFAISHGVMNGNRDQVYVLGSAIERSDQINVARALAAKERAEARLLKASDSDNIDIQRAQAALNRALIRLKVSELND